ncbi:DUF2281 domain-containing protein [Argonema antarcticum]|uniref:type II toxin-antitoxin system VapB family antitoxin n=1 Tax=Argonema antarcticum TaxID=2942763 RepID=UPI0020129C31|nr:DUF2281 domain-containing protein [Argonema antarcticum]MCL1469242.1 DUF2281 domain-containing protein [Argonema antarcticum A004/B2]
MTTDTALWKVVLNMPDALKKELLHYAEYLLEKYPNAQENTKKSEEIPQKPRLAGSMKGTFVLPLPDDFDEPLEDFEEYM